MPGRERDLADETSGVGELMDRLRDEAAALDAQLERILGEAARSNPPREVENVMRQSALEAEAGRRSAAQQEALNATRKLDDLARDLESARRLLVQPQLDRFRAAGETGRQSAGPDELGSQWCPASAGRASSVRPGAASKALTSSRRLSARGCGPA